MKTSFDIDVLTAYLEQQNGPSSGPALLYGRAKKHSGLEDINIYLFSPVVYVQLFKPINGNTLDRLLGLLKGRYPGNEYSIVDRSVNPPRMLYLSPSLRKDTIYKENGLSFYLDLLRPSHPGLFPDIEPARRWVFENSRDKSVLNLFAFTCAFSVCASAGGAAHVMNIDNNSNVLSRGRRNHQLNNHDMSIIRFEKKDVMKNFGFIDRNGPWDLIICDPPSAQGKSFTARKDYPRLARRLKKALADNGILMLCLNDPFLGFDFLEKIVAEEGLDEYYRIDSPEIYTPEDKNGGLKIMCVKNKETQEWKKSKKST